MEFVLTPEQMMAADRATIEGGTPLEALMERAAGALAWAARRLMGGTYGRRVVLVCGKGNNGGDGRVAARILASWGVRSEVLDLHPALDRGGFERALRSAHLAVDAMYGTGFRGRLEGDAAWAVAALNDSGVPVLACDIPSGVDGLTGAVEGSAVRAAHTVCFATVKSGLLFHPGAEHTGSIEVVPIGVDPTRAPGAPAYLVDAADVAKMLPARDFETHKWRVGGLLVVGGSRGMLGAANMVARSALRAGAGMVVLDVPGEDLAARAAGAEVVTQALPATAEGVLDEPAAKDVLEHLERFRAVVVGPGLGRDERTVAAVRQLVAEVEVPLLVDADGLNALAGDLDPLRERRASTVLTPHEGEFARLAGAPVGDDRLAAARRLAEGTGAVVLLKGSRTVIAHPDGRAVVNTSGSPALASAGTGDVLAGIIGALLAQGVDGMEAAAAGAFIHGRAGDVAGHAGLIAGDLIEALPATLAAIEALRT